MRCLDPHNEQFKRRQLCKAAVITDSSSRNAAEAAIEEVFSATHNYNSHGRKLYLIENCIHGVDIQLIAVQIAKLRFFISLAIEQNCTDDESTNYGIRPLPNLETKFVAANSLIGIESPKSPEAKGQTRFGTEEQKDLLAKEADLKAIRRNYFNAKTEKAKEALKKADEKVRQDIKSWLVEHSDWNDKTASRAFNWSPYQVDSVAKWFDPEWMFGIADGFDIVIGNPPYVGEKNNKAIFRPIAAGTLKKFYMGKMDLFYFFFHLALNFGKEECCNAFITTNYYPTAKGGRNLRTDVRARAIIRQIINFNELKIFESAAGQHNMITIFQLGCDDNQSAQICTTQRTGTANKEVIEAIVSQRDPKTLYHESSQTDLYDGENNYIRLLHPTVREILNGIKTQCGNTTLSGVCSVKTGMTTGADKVTAKHLEKFGWEAEEGDGIFVLSDSEVESLIAEGEKFLIRKFYKNSGVSRYHTNAVTTENVLYIGKSTMASRIPSVIRHLSRFQSLLKDSRNKTNSNWFVLQGARKEAIFTGAKIVVPQRSRVNTFGYNDIPWYASSDVYFITHPTGGVNLKYLLALLNSKLYFFWLYYMGKRKGEMLELVQTPLSEIPIKVISAEKQQPFIDLVDGILEAGATADTLIDETSIDNLVYDLYGLDANSNEVAIIEQYAPAPGAAPAAQEDAEEGEEDEE